MLRVLQHQFALNAQQLRDVPLFLPGFAAPQGLVDRRKPFFDLTCFAEASREFPQRKQKARQERCLVSWPVARGETSIHSPLEDGQLACFHSLGPRTWIARMMLRPARFISLPRMRRLPLQSLIDAMVASGAQSGQSADYWCQPVSRVLFVSEALGPSSVAESGEFPPRCSI